MVTLGPYNRVSLTSADKNGPERLQSPLQRFPDEEGIETWQYTLQPLRHLALQRFPDEEGIETW